VAQPASDIASRLSGKRDGDNGDIVKVAQGGALCHLQNGTGVREIRVGRGPGNYG
jgi:hypothetical protein